MKKTTQQQPVKTRRKYDDTFKQQALQMLRLGQSVPAVAAALGIGEGLLYQWKQGQRPDVLDQELEQLRARLKQVEAELLEGGAFRDVAEAATRNVRLHRALLQPHTPPLVLGLFKHTGL